MKFMIIFLSLLSIPFTYSFFTNNTPKRWVSWWYACDNNWPQTIDIIKNTTINTVTSVQTYCGWTVADNGTIIGSTSSQCQAFFNELIKLGSYPELTLDSGNCSIDSYRMLWKDTVYSPQILLQAALAVNASGWNIDLEPQGDNCKSGGTGTAADAVLFASWLAAVRSVLNKQNVRLTVDVASWSPVLSQYATLAPSVDRLQNMETYNGDSESQWLSYYEPFLNAVPLDKVGVGLGVWNDSNPSSWWETPAGGQTKIMYAIKDNVPELACFRLDPETNPIWPLQFWWPLLENYSTS